MSDRFDLEQQILDCWHIVDELKTLSEAVCDNNLSTDQTANILMGLEQLYQLKFDKLFQTFEELVHDESFEDRGEQASLFDDEIQDTNWQAPNQQWETNGWVNDEARVRTQDIRDHDNMSNMGNSPNVVLTTTQWDGNLTTNSATTETDWKSTDWTI